LPLFLLRKTHLIFPFLLVIALLAGSCGSSCKIKRCRIRLEHQHRAIGGDVQSPMPWCKEQNPKMGQYFKKKPDPSMRVEAGKTEKILQKNSPKKN